MQRAFGVWWGLYLVLICIILVNRQELYYLKSKVVDYLEGAAVQDVTYLIYVNNVFISKLKVAIACNSSVVGIVWLPGF